MAARILTDDERTIITTSNAFRKKIEQALRNQGAYWSVHDGSALMGSEEDRIKWAKNRINAVQIVLNDAYVNNPDLAIRAVKVSKGMSFDLAAAPLTEEQILAGFTDSNYETITSLLMDMFAEDVNMTVGGN